MLGKESVRASQRVDYSGYGDDEDNVVYEDNVIPHKKLPIRVSNMIFNGKRFEYTDRSEPELC